MGAGNYYLTLQIELFFLIAYYFLFCSSSNKTCSFDNAKTMTKETMRMFLVELPFMPLVYVVVRHWHLRYVFQTLVQFM